MLWRTTSLQSTHTPSDKDWKLSTRMKLIHCCFLTILQELWMLCPPQQVAWSEQKQLLKSECGRHERQSVIVSYTLLRTSKKTAILPKNRMKQRFLANFEPKKSKKLARLQESATWRPLWCETDQENSSRTEMCRIPWDDLHWILMLLAKATFCISFDLDQFLCFSPSFFFCWNSSVHPTFPLPHLQSFLGTLTLSLTSHAAHFNLLFAEDLFFVSYVFSRSFQITKVPFLCAFSDWLIKLIMAVRIPFCSPLSQIFKTQLILLIDHNLFYFFQALFERCLLFFPTEILQQKIIQCKK